MTSCASDKDDAIAWYLITKLIEAISSISPQPPAAEEPEPVQNSDQQPLADLAVSKKEAQAREKAAKAPSPGGAADNLISEPQTRLEDATVTDELVTRALKSARQFKVVMVIIRQ